MKIRGIDFTSAPSPSKPITCAYCLYEGKLLVLEDIRTLRDFDQFEALLAEPGEWIAGLDFPFGQSQKLVTNLGWPLNWSEYVQVVASMSRDEFVRTLEDYKDPRRFGDKEHQRTTDVRAGSISPQKLYGVPVAKMFFEGAKRLLGSSARIPPVRGADDSRVFVEAYPKLVAQRWTDGPYKHDTRRKQTDEHRRERERIIDGLRSSSFRQIYGFHAAFKDDEAKQMVGDRSGDHLDAFLCAVQAAWAYSQRDRAYGIPIGVPAVDLEGWIVDPSQQ